MLWNRLAQLSMWNPGLALIAPKMAWQIASKGMRIKSTKKNGPKAIGHVWYDSPILTHLNPIPVSNCYHFIYYLAKMLLLAEVPIVVPLINPFLFDSSIQHIEANLHVFLSIARLKQIEHTNITINLVDLFVSCICVGCCWGCHVMYIYTPIYYNPSMYLSSPRSTPRSISKWLQLTSFTKCGLC